MYMYAHVYVWKRTGPTEKKKGEGTGKEQKDKLHVFLYAEDTQADAYDTKAEGGYVPGRTGAGKSGEDWQGSVEGQMWATHNVNCDQKSPPFVP